MYRSGATCAADAYRMYAFHDMTRVLRNANLPYVVVKRTGPFLDAIVSEAALPLLARAGVSAELQAQSRAVPLSLHELGDDPVAFHQSRHHAQAFITAAEAHRLYPFKHSSRYNYVYAPWILAIFGLVLDPWNVQQYPDVDSIFENGNCFKVLDRSCDYCRRDKCDGRALVINYVPKNHGGEIQDMIDEYGPRAQV